MSAPRPAAPTTPSTIRVYSASSSHASTGSRPSEPHPVAGARGATRRCAIAPPHTRHTPPARKRSASPETSPPRAQRRGPGSDKMRRCLAVFPYAELRVLVARWRSDFPQFATRLETLRRAADAGLSLDVFTADELLRVCDAARIKVAARTADAARAAIVAARLDKFRHLPFSGVDIDTGAPPPRGDDDDTTSDDDARMPAPPLVKKEAPVPFDEPAVATAYWAQHEGMRDTTGVRVARAARVANRREYARRRGNYTRGEYVVFDNGDIAMRCTDSRQLGALVLTGDPPLTVNHFWTVVGAESDVLGPARVSFCDVVFERDTGIAAEQRPTVQGVRLTTRGERAVVDGIRFLIDTGARVSVISTAVAERLELRTEFPASFRDIIGLIGVANGCKTHWLTMTVPQLGEPSFSLPHLFVVYGDQCILGMDALHFFELRMRGQEPVTLRPLTD